MSSPPWVNSKYSLIGIAGLKGAGKDTAATVLHTRYKYRTHAFAAPVKEMLATMGLNWHELHGDLKEHPLDWLPGVTPRKLMTTLGTGWARGIDPNMWVRVVERRLRADTEAYHVVTDVRFENEADLIRRRGGVVIHILRHRETTWQKIKRRLFAHPSERGVKPKPGDFIVYNDSNIVTLERRMESIITGLWIYEPGIRLVS